MDLKKGDKVISKFHSGEEDIVRTILYIKKDERCESGYRANTDGGEVCKCCGAVKGKVIKGADIGWFSKVNI